ncbi:MAG: hypothetical protein IJV13_00400 [Prevotella sp.]|nr:hypothetical protein [Prevotella sp.]MBQ9650669.1 hypothetical protein [Prevotella sp.]
MPAIKASSLELRYDVIVVKPLRGNSDIVRTEKKYDRHGFGEVIIGNPETLTRHTGKFDNGFAETEYRSVNKGDLVVYDDSDAIEVPLQLNDEESPIMVEFIGVHDVKAIDRRIVVLKEEK